MRTRSNLVDKATNKATTPRPRAKKFSTDPKKGHKCGICHRILGRKSDLDRHMDTHSDLPPRYPCELGCGMRFWQKAARATHHDTQQHNDRRDHVCPECSRAFSEKGAMKRHLSEIHGEGKYRSYDCHCGKSYKRRSSWRNHFNKAHRGERSSTPEPTYRDPKPSAAKHNYTGSNRMVPDEGHGDAVTEVTADVYKLWSETDATTTGDSSPVYTPIAAGPNQNLNTNELAAALRNMLIEEPHSASLETLQQNGQPRIACSINIASKSGLETLADVATVREIGADDEETQIDEIPSAVRRGRETFALSFVLN
ncbi:hypothetical protein SISNIDRAFT_489177 [Sistotremastrum niveocremeum HHB9708]|uniref:C2H2-type domain-containing protein n=1 Tax=Sistotremastrum niveocremeum HHB9708 TaxID=1314777 RepID=A0A164QAZ5_9AGAM|nr:hypothetical protein SISNIDRAFT_489177 [Sistotremastrum niveocremeum HHB9708]